MQAISKNFNGSGDSHSIAIVEGPSKSGEQWKAKSAPLTHWPTVQGDVAGDINRWREYVLRP